MNKYLIIVSMALISFWIPVSVYAIDKESGSTGKLTSEVTDVISSDDRVNRLEMYLKSKNSDLAREANYIVSESDKYGIDWKLIPAIAGLESSFCKHIPTNSYNCWGWGIFTGQNSGIGFLNYQNGVSIVTSGLRERYYNKGLITLEEIGSVYAASPTWSSRVRSIMEDIEHFMFPESSKSLAFTL